MSRIQNDSPADSALSDFAKRKQLRREQGIEWSERMMKANLPASKPAHPKQHGISPGPQADLPSEFLSLLIAEPESRATERVGGNSSTDGTKANQYLLKEQVGKKTNVQSSQFTVTTQDFGVAEVDVAEKSGLICLVVTVDHFVDLNQSKILEHLVAARLGRQFGKNFEVQIVCKSGM